MAVDSLAPRTLRAAAKRRLAASSVSSRGKCDSLMRRTFRGEKVARSARTGTICSRGDR